VTFTKDREYVILQLWVKTHPQGGTEAGINKISGKITFRIGLKPLYFADSILTVMSRLLAKELDKERIWEYFRDRFEYHKALKYECAVKNLKPPKTWPATLENTLKPQTPKR
jgi:hypothetical protein